MLQQTQVVTVVPYFHRFIKRFPTIGSLARAPKEEVLRYWQGLGYYRRAINLHTAAQELVANNRGEIPKDGQALCELPGIGRYIAGAIQSFAFAIPAPVVEANSIRVLCRLFAISRPPTDGRTNRLLWELADQLLDRQSPAIHNQAIMELGALVCTPTNPQCSQCPLRAVCRARRDGVVHLLPRSARRPAPVAVEDAAAIVQHRGQVLIVQRPVAERWGGLWELPRTTIANGEEPRDRLRRFVSAELGLEIAVGMVAAIVKHSVTHHRITLTAYRCELVGGIANPGKYAACRWARPARLCEFPCSTPQRKLFAHLGA